MGHHSIHAARVKSLIYSIYDGFFYSCMVGFGETYISAYAIFLGASNFQLGLLTSLPPFFAGISQFSTVALFEKFRSRKKLVCWGVLAQALCFCPLVLAYSFGTLKIEFYILISTLYLTANAVIGPVWNSWIGDLVPVLRRGGYFGRRNRIMTVGVFLSMTLAGFILRYFKDRSAEFTGFLAVFVLAFLCRLCSLYFLNLKYDPKPSGTIQDRSGFFDFLKDLRSKNYGNLFLYMCAVNFGVFVAAAYFTPYLLRNLHYSYSTYTLVIAGTALAKFISSPLWGRLSDRFGARQILLISGFLICFSTLPWIFLAHPLWIFLAQCYAGFVWSGYELSTFTLLLESTTPSELTRVSSYLNIATSISGLFGGILGVVLISPAAAFLHPFSFVFLLSALVRIGSFFVYARRLRGSVEMPQTDSLVS